MKMADSTYTTAKLELPSEMYEYIREKLLEAGYEHAVDDKENRVDMTHIHVSPEELNYPLCTAGPHLYREWMIWHEGMMNRSDLVIEEKYAKVVDTTISLVPFYVHRNISKLSAYVCHIAGVKLYCELAAEAKEEIQKIAPAGRVWTAPITETHANLFNNFVGEAFLCSMRKQILGSSLPNILYQTYAREVHKITGLDIEKLETRLKAEDQDGKS